MGELARSDGYVSPCDSSVRHSLMLSQPARLFYFGKRRACTLCRKLQEHDERFFGALSSRAARDCSFVRRPLFA